MDVVVAGRHHNAIIGTLAAWTLCYCPSAFAGSERMRADSHLAYMHQQPPGTRPRLSTGEMAATRSSIRKLLMNDAILFDAR